MDDLVSIVVAVYNAEKYLRKCVDSLLDQTYKNTEIILVNDCSEDSSLSVCNEYSSEYKNVVTINNDKNLGVSATRNRGIDVSTGKYICFVDSDDYVEPNYLEELYNSLVKSNTLLSVCGCEYHNLIDGTNNCFLWKEDSDLEIVSFAQGFELRKALYLNALWNKLFVTRLIKDNNLLFDESLSMGEDTKFTLEYIKYNNITELAVLSKPLYHYIRWSTTSLMSNYYKQIDSNKYLDNINMLFEIVKPLNSNANELYDDAVDSLKKNMKYSVLSSTIPKKEKKCYIKQLYPDYSFVDSVKDSIGMAKGKIAKFLHRRKMKK